MKRSGERQLKILALMSVRRKETMANLAAEFDVSVRTIKEDISELSADYPLYTMTGPGGGIRVMSGWEFGMKYMSDKQEELLRRLAETMIGDDLQTIQSILKTFSIPKKSKISKKTLDQKT